MLTDLEINSAYRGAVEIFSLCRNLHPRDALFAECNRAFNSCTIDGQAWLWRLHISQESRAIDQQSFETYIPPTKTPQVRCDRSKANEYEAYGYRPLCYPWNLLSPYEFLRDWEITPLLVPPYYENHLQTARAEWTKEGLRSSKSDEYASKKVAAKPGLYFRAIPCPTNTYFLFPEEPQHIFGTYRHSWA